MPAVDPLRRLGGAATLPLWHAARSTVLQSESWSTGAHSGPPRRVREGIPTRHHSNRALLGAMGRVCSRRRRRSRAWRARDVSNYGAVTPPRRGPRPHASAEEPLPRYSVPYASRNPRIGPNHSHRMRRSELCRGANGPGHASDPDVAPGPSPGGDTRVTKGLYHPRARGSTRLRSYPASVFRSRS